MLLILYIVERNFGKGLRVIRIFTIICQKHLLQSWKKIRLTEVC